MDRGYHENSLQDLSVQLECEGSFIDKSTSPVKANCLLGGINKDIREHIGGDHAFNMLQKQASNASALVFRRDVKKTDFIHIQTGHTQYPIARFINCYVEEPRTLLHTLRGLHAADFTEERRRIGGIPIQTCIDQRATG